MEISGRILREVEFRDRLRGYDTDEVDEFLEKVAVGVDELTEQLAAARARAEEAERRAEDHVPMDDDSIRRTLVLAQRTADLAISEAREEAARLVEAAEGRAAALVADAEQHVARLRTAAEEELQARVGRLRSEQARLEAEVARLAALVDGERHRLAAALEALLGHLHGLEVSPELSALATTVAPVSEVAPAEAVLAEAEAPTSTPSLFPEGDGDPIDLDDELDLRLEPAPVLEAPARPDPEDGVLDPDEELWERWARSGENDVARAEDDAFRLGPRDP